MSTDPGKNTSCRELLRFSELVQQGMVRAVKDEIAELRRLKLPIITSKDGKIVDLNPDTNTDASAQEMKKMK